MPMSPRTLRPRNALHPEAANWAARVVANGGTVGTSLPAVSAFCSAIGAVAGLRACFTRLNLFCGGPSGTAAGLNACLVPLYRSPVPGGAPLGGATDTNTGSVFVTADYTETGASGGLLGDGSTKYLNTGLNVDALAAASCHLAAYICGTQDITTGRALVGAMFNGVSDRYRLFLSQTGTPAVNYFVQSELGKANNAFSTLANANGGLLLSSRTTASKLDLYDDGVATGTPNTTATAELTGATPFLVFARTGPTEFYNGRMAGYSIGAGMSSAQVAAYSTAMLAFQTALGRA
jgi:hypothetical protein